MIYLLFLFFISISVLSCSIDDPDDNPKYKRVFLNIDAESDSVGFPDSSPEINIGKYGYASFLNPNSNLGLDTVTIPLDGLLSFCTVYSEYFSCHSNPCPLEPLSPDTIFINYGESKLMNYLPYQKIPPFDKQKFLNLFSVLDVAEQVGLSDTIELNYALSQNGLFPEIDFFRVRSSYQMVPKDLIIVDPCYGKVSYPSLSVYAYQLQKKNNSAVVPKDTTITWTLIYTDQYGRSDSLEVKTKFR